MEHPPCETCDRAAQTAASTFEAQLLEFHRAMHDVGRTVLDVLEPVFRWLHVLPR